MSHDDHGRPATPDIPDVPDGEVVDQASWTVPPAESEEDSSLFVWLAMALLVLVAGAVYVVGSVSRAGEDAARARDRAENALEDFDPDEFSNEFDESETLPLADPTDTTAAPSTTDPAVDDSAGGETEPDAPVGPHPGVVIDPGDIAMAFVNRVPGDEYGLVGYLDFDGDRHQTELECGRVDRNEAGGVCLSVGGGLAGTGQGLILDPALVPTKTFGLTTPSRAAISPDGAVVAWTGFTRGHSYLEPGEFATLTQVISIERSLAANLETNFVTYDGDTVVRNADRNYWGVTFVDSDHFFATIGYDDMTAVVEGRISNARMDVVFPDATCPEVSPDGTTVVAKEMRGDRFQLVAIDVETGARRDLGETRSVDDQIEWVDDDTIVYGLPNDAEGTAAQPVFDIWALDVTPGAEPRLLVPFADSPAV